MATNAQTYEDCIAGYEKEAAMKDKRIRELEGELKVANEAISRLELQIQDLTAELEEEKSLNANLTSTVSELRNELDVAQTNSGGYDDIIAILRKEAEEYQTQLTEARGEAESYKQKKIDLEELISKTKDSLVDEKKRVVNALEEKDVRIAQLDRELAEKFNEIHSTNARLTKMTKRFNSEKDRTDALERKIQKLNQLSVNNNDVKSSEDVDRLNKLLEDVSKSNDEYKSLMHSYEDKVKFMTQQLLLSGQSVSNKQSEIVSLKEELSNAVTKAEANVEDQLSTSNEVANLKTKLDEVQSKSTVWKAQANGMIVQLTNELREKNASVVELQNKLVEEQKAPNTSTINEALEKEINELKAAMEEAQLRAKEKIKQKNQSLKELEDIVASLTGEMEDLKREKDQITDRLEKEMRRSNDDLQSHERQLRQTEDRLAKEHIVAMAQMEQDMNETIHELEMEIQSLKEKADRGDLTPLGGLGSTATVRSAHTEHLKLLEMEKALQRSKEKEVSLISENMKMQHRIQNLQVQAQEQKQQASRVVTSVMDDDDDEDDEENDAVDLPTYYKEKQRPIVIRFVGNAWKKIFRRRKKV